MQVLVGIESINNFLGSRSHNNGVAQSIYPYLGLEKRPGVGGLASFRIIHFIFILVSAVVGLQLFVRQDPKGPISLIFYHLYFKL